MPLSDAEKVAAIIADAGGEVVGRTRLQKIAYLLSVTGLEDAFSFKYKHYGPYSEELAIATRVGKWLGNLNETEKNSTWGGTYSVYSIPDRAAAPGEDRRSRLARVAANADAIALELAATAVFLANEGYELPWQETARRKPDKATEEQFKKAREIVRELSQIKTPKSLPAII